MAKRKDKEELPVPAEQKGQVFLTPLEEVLPGSMLPYAEYVILDRALPRVEDGLKPVQRRILYTMYDMGLTPDKPHKKCARIVGDCMGKYHPHGDSSVYDAMVQNGAGLQYAHDARKRARQLRLCGRRSRRGDALYRGAPGTARARTAARHRKGHRCVSPSTSTTA